MSEIAKLDKLCIICLNTETLTSILQLEYQEVPAETLLKDLNLIKFENENISNRSLCRKCCKLLYSFHCMRKQFFESQKIFQLSLKNSTNTKTAQTPIIDEPKSNKCIDCVCSNITASNLPTICRICFHQTDIHPIGNLTIGEHTAIKLYEQFSSQNIQSDEMLCLVCLDHLLDVSNFRNKFENHDFIVHNLQNDQTNLKLASNQTNYSEIIDDLLEIAPNELINERTPNKTKTKQLKDKLQNEFENNDFIVHNLQNEPTNLKLAPEQTNYPEIIVTKLEITSNVLTNAQTKIRKKKKQTTPQHKRKTKDSTLTYKISCSHCPLTFDTKAAFTLHTSETQTHTIFRTKIECAACKRLMRTPSEYKLHVDVSHRRVQPFACAACGRRFSLKKNLARHALTHTDERPFVCDRCGARFIRIESLQEHGRSRHDGATYACAACGRAFRTLLTLQRHTKRYHGAKGGGASDARPFVCETCGAAYAYRSTLVAHQETHGDRRYVCVACNKGFAVRRRLEVHMRAHGEKPFDCEVCGKRFASSAKLSEHFVNSGDKTFKCRICLKLFHTSDGLRKHNVRTHEIKRESVCV